MKKILITYASYGGGHLSAAKNVKEYIEEIHPDCQVVLLDGMRALNKITDKIGCYIYSKITGNIPWFWGTIYYGTQKPFLEKIITLLNKLLAFKLGKVLKKEEPDIIISTHFFTSHMCSILKQRGKINSTLATIITDYGDDPYNEWTNNHNYADYIFVAHDGIKTTLIKKGVPGEKVLNTGIPVSNKFLIKYDKEKIYKEFNLDKNKKTVLFFGGSQSGIGKSKTLDIFKYLLINYPDLQIIALAGKNQALKNKFEKIISENGSTQNVRIIGFTNKVAELMAISNLVITKPGGLTSTEALVSNVPLVAINPIAGQEEENAEFLCRNEAAIWLKKTDDISQVLSKILDNDDLLNQMKENTKKIAKPNSTKEICETLL